MANYKQLGKNNWQVVVSLGFGEDGKRNRIKKQGFRTKKDAEIFVTETLDKKNKGFITPVENNIMFKDFITEWFYDYKIKTIAITTRDNYISRMNNHIIPKLGSYKLNKITNIIIQKFYNGLIDEGLKPSSAKKLMEILNSCFKYAKKNKLIYELPTDIEKMKIDKPKIFYWNKDEIDYFLKQVKNEYLYCPVFITVLTGLRVAELCGLRWYDINLVDRTLKVRNQVIQDKSTKELIFSEILKTTTSYRTISIPIILTEFLKDLKGSALESDFVVLNRSGSMCNPRNLSMDFTKKVFKFKNKENNKINNYMQLPQITFHGLRHTHATLLILNGENVKVVSERLGHKDITTTLNTYTHVMQEMKNNTADLLDDIFNFEGDTRGHQGDTSSKMDKKNSPTA